MTMMASPQQGITSPVSIHDVLMEPQFEAKQAPAQRHSPHQGSAIEMMIHSMVNMVQAGRTNPAKADGSRLLLHDH
jgi:hypothetical protein